MKILFLSFYFEPDLSAGSFRNSPLAKHLALNNKVHVITTSPNRYQSFEKKAANIEELGSLTIHRIDLPSHKSGLMDQILAFKVYFFAALKLVKNEKYDLVYASSSRLFTAFLGSFISKKKGIPLFLDIRDIFRETINDVVAKGFKGALISKVIFFVENYTFKRAKHINLVSPGFKDYFEPRFKTQYSYLPNGIDDSFLFHDPLNKKVESKKLITYAGNIGASQALHKLIPGLAKELGEGFIVRIIGDGGKKDLLVENIGSLNNVEFHPPVDRNGLLKLYQESDYLLVSLEDVPAFKRVLPSKLFEYAAMDKFVIGALAGYSKQFVEAEISSSFVVNPGDFKGLAKFLKTHELEGNISRDDFKLKFARNNITKELALLIQG
jgi:hypothetical protein